MKPTITTVIFAAGLLVSWGCMSHRRYVRPSRFLGTEGVHAGTYRANDGFGYIGFGVVEHNKLLGDNEDLEPGTGASVTIPLAPGLAVAVVVVGLVAALAAVSAGGGGSFSGSGGDLDLFDSDDDMWDCGVADSTVAPLSERSLDMTASFANHPGPTGTGDVTYRALMFGGRLASSRARLLRVFGTLGYGLYWLEGESVGSLGYNGLYAGVGADFVPHPQCTLGVDWRRHFFSSGDAVEAGSGASQTMFNVTLYW